MIILTIGCHPGDHKTGFGGTLTVYTKKGHNVFMLHVARGDKGDEVIMPLEYTDITERLDIKIEKSILKTQI